VLSTLAFGLAPALGLSQADLLAPLKAGGYRTASVRTQQVRAALVIAEVALSLVLLVTAGLMLRSLSELQRVDVGFRRDGLLTFNVALPRAKYDSSQLVSGFYRKAFERFRALQGVDAVGAVNLLPLAADGASGFSFQIVGRPPFESADRPSAEFLEATPDYFRAMGIPLLHGRSFTDGDGPMAPPVIIISKRMADRFSSGGDPVGAALSLPGNPTSYNIIGVVGDVHTQDVDKPDKWQGQMYLANDQLPSTFMTIIVRSQGPSTGHG